MMETALLLADVLLCYAPAPSQDSEEAFLNWSLNREVWPEVGTRIATARQQGRYGEADAAKQWLEQTVGVQVRDSPTQSVVLPR